MKRFSGGLLVVLVMSVLMSLFVPMSFGGDRLTASAACGVKDKGIKSSPYGGEWGLHPEIQKKADELIALAKKNGLNIRILEGYRSSAYQNSLYAQGRTCGGNIVTNAKGGQSNHNFGLAFDIVFDYGYAEKDSNGKGGNDWAEMGKYGKSIGLDWGGDWSGFPDRPHYEYTWGLTLEQLRAGKLPPKGKAIKGDGKGEEVKDKSKEDEEFVGDRISYSDIFKKGKVLINNIGVDDRKVEVSHENAYAAKKYGGAVGTWLFNIARALCIVVILYLSALWLVYLMAYTGMMVAWDLLSKMTLGAFDFEDEGVAKKMLVMTFIAFVIVSIVIGGMLPKIAALVLEIVRQFFEYLTTFG